MKKLIFLVVLIILNIFNPVFSSTIDGLIYYNYSKRHLTNPEALKALDKSMIVLPNLDGFVFEGPYYLYNRAYDHIPFYYAIVPEIFYQAYNAVETIKNYESFFLRNKKAFQQTYEYYENKKFKDDMAQVNSVYKKNQNYTLGYLDATTQVRLMKKYASIINRWLNYSVWTKTEVEWKDWLKNIIWINNNDCNDYKTCAKKAYIWNNADNLTKQDINKIWLQTVFQNNIRNLTLNQAENFLWDFFFSDVLAVWETYKQLKSRSYYYTMKVDDQKVLRPSKKKELLTRRDNEFIQDWKLKPTNLKQAYFNLTDLLNRYYAPSVLWMVKYIFWVDTDHILARIDYHGLVKATWIESNNVFVKKWTNWTQILAFVSDLDLPSVFVGKKITPAMYEKQVYWNNKWLFDSLYTNTSIWTEDYKNITCSTIDCWKTYHGIGSPDHIINGYSIPQLKYMNITTDFGEWINFQFSYEKATLVWLKDQGLISSEPFKRYQIALRYFPTYINSWFKIEISNNSNVVKNILNNPNSFYNQVKKILNGHYWDYPKNIKKHNNSSPNIIYVKPPLKVGDPDSYMTASWTGLWLSGDWPTYLAKKEYGYHVANIYADWPSVLNWEFNERLQWTINEYNYLKTIKEKLTKKIQQLDNETYNLWKELKVNPDIKLYKQFIDKYAEQLLYSAQLAELRKKFYPLKVAVEYKVPADIRDDDVTLYSSAFLFNVWITPDTTSKEQFEAFKRMEQLYNKLHNYYYPRKSQQMKQDGIKDVKLWKVLAEIDYSNISPKWMKVVNIIKEGFFKYENKFSLKNPFVKMPDVARKKWTYWTFYDLPKFKRIVQQKYSDSKYLQSEWLNTVKNYLTQLGVYNNLRPYYKFANIYSTSDKLPNMFDFTGWFYLDK